MLNRRGELTQLGKEEHFGIGTRLFHRLQSLFTNACTISVMTSGKKRAVDSVSEFVGGLAKYTSNLRIENENPDSTLLYFHQTCSDYVTFKKNDSQIRRKIDLKRPDKSQFYRQPQMDTYSLVLSLVLLLSCSSETEERY